MTFLLDKVRVLNDSHDPSLFSRSLRSLKVEISRRLIIEGLAFLGNTNKPLPNETR